MHKVEVKKILRELLAAWTLLYLLTISKKMCMEYEQLNLQKILNHFLHFEFLVYFCQSSHKL